MSQDTHSESGEVTKRDVAWFCIRHPLPALAMGLAALIGMAMGIEVDWSIAMGEVRAGRTCDGHLAAEGYDE